MMELAREENDEDMVAEAGEELKALREKAEALRELRADPKTKGWTIEV